MDYGRLLEKFNFDSDDTSGRDRIPGLRSTGGSGWATTPKMMEALELEHSGMGRDGAHTMGSTLPTKMNFRGRVVGPDHGWILVSVRWPLKAVDPSVAASVPQRFVNEQGGAPLDGLVVSPWQAHGFDIPDGWELDRETLPSVRLYHSEVKFARSSEIVWSPTEQALPMKPLPDTLEARAQELRAWKHDIETITSDRSVLNGQDFIASGLLVDLFQKNCAGLPPSFQQGLCFEADSPEVRALHERDAQVAKADAPFRNTGWGRAGTVHGWENYMSDRSLAPGLTTDCTTTPDVPGPNRAQTGSPLQYHAPLAPVVDSGQGHSSYTAVLIRASAPAGGPSRPGH